MKFGFRIPSLTKRIAARTSVKRIIRHNLGFKAPRGWGWITNSKKALYNRVYNRSRSIWVHTGLQKKGFNPITLNPIIFDPTFYEILSRIQLKYMSFSFLGLAIYLSIINI
jgi:hypothetical protein